MTTNQTPHKNIQMIVIRKCLFSFAALFAASSLLHSSPLVDNWTYAGGGLDPESYTAQPDKYRPTPINPDAANNNGATIVATNLVVIPFGSGGLGSANAGAYQGIYTFNASNASFALTSGTILDSLDEITITIVAGGGFPTLLTYNSSTLSLNYNGSNPALASSSFLSTDLGIISTPVVGDLNLFQYTWTWTGLASLGETTQFSTSWNVQGQQHAFFQEISLTQAVPEPSTVALIAIGGAFCALRRRRR
ncbi:MAG: PEP-CTERM sorting domain-containing protein [Terrimicrobiaceae bacterium]